MFPFLCSWSLLNPHQATAGAHDSTQTSVVVKFTNDPIAKSLSQRLTLISLHFLAASDSSSLKQFLHSAPKPPLSWFSSSLISCFFSSSFTSSISSPHRWWSSPRTRSWTSVFYLHSLPCGFHSVSIVWRLAIVYLQPRLLWIPDQYIQLLAGQLQNWTPDLSPKSASPCIS